MTHPSPKRNMVPKAVLMKSDLVSVNTARQVNIAHTKTTVNGASPMSNLFKTTHSTIKRPINKNTSFKNRNFNLRVNTVKDKNVNTIRPKAVVNVVRPKAVVNAVKGNNVNAIKASACWVWKPKTKGKSRGQGKSVKGLPSKLFENNQTCVACKKGKQHRASSRTPQQNRVAERKNRTLIEAARTMLADSKLPTTFWVEAVNTACYVQNRVLVTKPHNKSPYELFLRRKPALGFMRPFGCSVTILNTIDYLGKFDGNADEGFFVSEDTPNITRSGPNWIFDIDALTKSMKYKPVVAGNQSNGNAGTKACDDAGKARIETVPSKDYILLPLWTADPSFSQSLKSSPNDGSKPSSDDEKKVDENPRKDKILGKTSIELPDDLNMPTLEDIVYSDDDEDVVQEATKTNFDAFRPVQPIQLQDTSNIIQFEQIIGDLNQASSNKKNDQRI
ncbi:ribonuclease H-like domain-containing protein [Tanacetum coccineum]|uniref:Ribonuclease H-like domain-containing protein n=1 Tax=Tanacetum coccineum TaxID=301880 RepID=A0ABQ5FEY1_9ASTR